MAIFPIVTYDDEVLRQKAEPVESNNEKFQIFIDDMFETMYNANGIGLAAPQIGVSKRIFVIDADSILDKEEEELYGPVAFINPEILSTSGEDILMEEGCLSLPELNDKVKRPDIIKIKYLNRDFEEEVIEVGGWMSRVIQHEYDHLEGILFIDHINLFRRRLHKSELDDIANGLVETSYPLAPKL